MAVRKDLRSVGEDSDSLACAIATAPAIESSRPGQRHRLRGWLSRTSASRYEHKSVLCVIPPHCRIPLSREPSATSLRRLIAYASSVGLRRPGVLNITASCVHTGGFTVTLTACSSPRPRFAQCSRQFAGILRANAAASPEKEQPGLLPQCSPMRLAPPPILSARLLPSPRRLRGKLIGSLRSKKRKRSFFVSAASFSGPAFSDSAFLSVALTASPQDQPAHSWRPSEDHFHGGGLGLPLFHEGRRTEDAMQSRKKRP